MQKISTDKIDIKKKLFSIFTNFVSMVLKPKILRPVQFTRSVVSNSLRLQVLYIIRGILQARMGSLYLLQRIFPTQGLNPGLPHCRRILYQLSLQGRPKRGSGGREWAADGKQTLAKARGKAKMGCVWGGVWLG